MWDKKKVVMLPTNEKVKMWLNKFSNQLHIDTVEKENHENAINQHLYFLSSEEIKEGDWCFDIVNGKVLKADHDVNYEQDVVKKIIATTNTNLIIDKYYPQFTVDKNPIIKYLPQIPQSFIEYFIFQYNKGNIITEVMVEYILNNEDFDDIIEKVWDNDYKLKINVKDNTINIKPIIPTSEEIGEKIVQYCKKYEGTNKYNDVLKAIEFGYQLSLNKDEK